MQIHNLQIHSLRSLLVLGALCLSGLTSSSARATGDRASRTRAQLRDEATHVVVARVIGVRSRVEPSAVDPGFGNRDKVVTCSLSISAIEKGEGLAIGADLDARCFVACERRSFVESLSLGGHNPIPAKGQDVRAHLVLADGVFRVVYPNGFASLSPDLLVEPAEVRKLRRVGIAFSYVFPLEFWSLGALGALTYLLARWTVFRRARAE